jgi:lipooligosaccharide transport system permease protein
MARILVERNIISFRHGWIAIVTGFAEPVFYLFSLGIGLGSRASVLRKPTSCSRVLSAVAGSVTP